MIFRLRKGDEIPTLSLYAPENWWSEKVGLAVKDFLDSSETITTKRTTLPSFPVTREGGCLDLPFV